MARPNFTFRLLNLISLNLPPNAASTIATAFSHVFIASRTKGHSKPNHNFSICESAAAHKTGETDKNDTGVRGVRYWGTESGQRATGGSVRLLVCRVSSMSTDVSLRVYHW